MSDTSSLPPFSTIVRIGLQTNQLPLLQLPHLCGPCDPSNKWCPPRTWGTKYTTLRPPALCALMRPQAQRRAFLQPPSRRCTRRGHRSWLRILRVSVAHLRATAHTAKARRGRPTNSSRRRHRTKWPRRVPSTLPATSATLLRRTRTITTERRLTSSHRTHSARLQCLPTHRSAPHVAGTAAQVPS
jgi:hypothetical protein